MANNSHPFCEFNRHGIVRVQFEGIGIVIPAWLKCFEDSIEEKPDITVQFVEQLDDTSSVRFIEFGRYGYTKSGFAAYPKNAASRKVSIPLESIDESYIIRCEIGVNSLPLFEELVHLAAIKAESLLLHASAFQYEGKTILASRSRMGAKRHCCSPSLHVRLS